MYEEENYYDDLINETSEEIDTNEIQYYQKKNKVEININRKENTSDKNQRIKYTKIVKREEINKNIKLDKKNQSIAKKELLKALKKSAQEKLKKVKNCNYKHSKT